MVCVWCGVVWCGVVWCGVVWCGVVWCGVVWCGVVWCGVCLLVGVLVIDFITTPILTPSSGFPLQYSPFNTPLIPSSLSILWECQRMLDVEVLRQSDQLISILVDSCCTHIFPNIDMVYTLLLISL